jgi:type IV pilus assembly protein PilA
MGHQQRKGFTLVEIMIVVAIVGILSAIAIPNFLKFQAKSKQTEVRATLKGLFASEKSFFAERDSYSSAFDQLGIIPERGNRYAYYLAPQTNVQLRSAATLPPPLTTHGFQGIAVDVYRVPGAIATPAVLSVPDIIAENSVVTVAPPGVAVGPNGSFVAMASGTIDNDADNDVWAISGGVNLEVADSACSPAQKGPSGIPINTNNDVSCP